MARRPMCWLALLCCGGCLPFGAESQNALVSNNPFGMQATPQAPARTNFPAGSEQISLKVDEVGKKVVAANPQLGMRPLFGTIGAPKPEIFHLDTRMVYVTEGLVKQCKNEAELAAVLSFELGRMVAEREAKAGAGARNPDRLPPIQVQVGNAGRMSGEDGIAQVELAKFEKVHPRKGGSLPVPDAKVLARTYLEKAGFLRTDLDNVGPLLAEAERNMDFERQFKGSLPQSKWAP